MLTKVKSCFLRLFYHILLYTIIFVMLPSCTRKDANPSNVRIVITEVWFDYHYVSYLSYMNSSNVKAPENFSFTVQITNDSDSTQRFPLRSDFEENSMFCSYFKMVVDNDTVDFSFVPKEILVRKDTRESVAVSLPFTSYLKLRSIFFNNLSTKEKINKVLAADYAVKICNENNTLNQMEINKSLFSDSLSVFFTFSDTSVVFNPS